MIQTRSDLHGIQEFKTLQDALDAAREDSSIWKISFEIEDGTRIRLIATDEGWTYENIITGHRND